MRMWRIGVFFLITAGCGSPTDEFGWRLETGMIDPALSSVQAVVIPASARAGERFTVTINTLGSSNCTRGNGTAVEIMGMRALLTPLNYTAPAGTTCTQDLVVFPHSLQLQFGLVGQAEVVVHARLPNGAETDTSFVVQIVQ